MVWPWGLIHYRLDYQPRLKSLEEAGRVRRNLEEPGRTRKSQEGPWRTRKSWKAQVTVTMAGLWKMRGSKNKNNNKKKQRIMSPRLIGSWSVPLNLSTTSATRGAPSSPSTVKYWLSDNGPSVQCIYYASVVDNPAKWASKRWLVDVFSNFSRIYPPHTPTPTATATAATHPWASGRFRSTTLDMWHKAMRTRCLR